MSIILLDIIDALDISPQSSGLEKDLEWTDKILYEVPNVTNLSVTEAKKLLVNFNIEYTGTGQTVVSQSPEAGSKLEDRGTIRLLLE